MREGRIKELAREIGFDLVGIAAAKPAIEALFYPEWLARGYAGEMSYLEGERGEIRADPRKLLPTARSIICLGLVYNTSESYSTEAELDGRGWVSRYAWGRDYHNVIRKMLKVLAGRLQREFGEFDFKPAVDTSPLLERAYAHQAGLGWIGQNTCLINERLGSWVFLAELITSLDLEPDGPAPFRCGTCTRCIEACPTDALVPTGKADGPAYALDSRLCISYWTIELRGAIPEEGRAGMGGHLFGCDICQDVCPWNRRAAVTDEASFESRNGRPRLDELASLSEEEFNERFAGTPIKRAKYRGFLRNVAVAMGNSGDRQFLNPLRRLAASDDPLIREHAEWAISRLGGAETLEPQG